MIKPSIRASSTSAYYFSQKLSEISQLEAQGRTILNLGIGNPDRAPDPKVTTALIEAAGKEEAHQYQSYRCTPALRQALSAWYKRCFGVVLHPQDEVLPLIGSKEGIMHLSLAFLDKGDEVLIPDPGYPIYASAAAVAGARAVPYNLTAAQGWLPDVAELESLISPATKMLWLNFPGNPTGAVASRADLQALIAFAHKYQILLCHDNPYALVLNEEPLSILRIDGAKEVAVELNSLSKSHNMPGWRLGMLAGKAAYLNAVAKMKSYSDTGIFRPIQEAAIVALEADEGWYKLLQHTYLERRELICQLLDTLQCTYATRGAGLYLWAAIPAGWQDSFAYSNYLLNTFDLFVAPGPVYGRNGAGYIRVALTQPAEALAQLLQKVQQHELSSLQV
ncbi:aminotransferase class I/II-fold pyridoxal phosphate-dependent enzyme [Pontibacter sp. HSC-14F20]|uniref:pyridoxal phosphate-dependent aminotransferase n=1 Tax=Pontibacter sp. HSC-14F20 TaxID=2864136 RepID=UPI001C73B27D|nr:aminotransferase class I/II-fold pyridoxal phosphate-dependent enzyme [Pontibacter sp. HSC-14F20]MBX0335149.1 aminotransferase class I/II-fold pyridoxal phosphate-dependent enzyme [Pontibacter sp. HSC-14F20]